MRRSSGVLFSRSYTDLLLSSAPEMETGWLEVGLSRRRMESAGN